MAIQCTKRVNRCATCHLSRHSCPGHCGHMELPVPVYHPNFLKQCLRLLRATCIYCHHFKLSRIEVHLYSCKLRLLQHGLAQDAEIIDDFDLESVNKKRNNMDDDNEIHDEDHDEIINRRVEFVDNAISQAKLFSSSEEGYYVQNESLFERRMSVTKNFLLDIAKVKKCAHCEG